MSKRNKSKTTQDSPVAAEARVAKQTGKDDPTPRLSQSEQLRKYKALGRYEPYVVGDKQSIDNGDAVAKLLRGADVSVVIRAAEKLKQLDPGSLATKYATLNRGSKRMNAGNVIRGFVKRGDNTPEEIAKVIKQANSEIHAAK